MMKRSGKDRNLWGHRRFWVEQGKLQADSHGASNRGVDDDGDRKNGRLLVSQTNNTYIEGKSVVYGVGERGKEDTGREVPAWGEHSGRKGEIW